MQRTDQVYATDRSVYATDSSFFSPEFSRAAAHRHASMQNRARCELEGRNADVIT